MSYVSWVSSPAPLVTTLFCHYNTSAAPVQCPLHKSDLLFRLVASSQLGILFSADSLVTLTWTLNLDFSFIKLGTSFEMRLERLVYSQVEI